MTIETEKVTEYASNVTNPFTTTIIPRGSWRSNQAFKNVTQDGAIPFDIRVMNCYDSLVRSGGSALWNLAATSNGSFFLFPEKKEKLLRMCSPNGYEADVSVEVSGIVATLFALSSVGSRAAGDAYVRLQKFAYQLSDAEVGQIHWLID